MKRKEGESFEDYKARRAADKKKTKRKLRGHYKWLSKRLAHRPPPTGTNIEFNNGTYIKEKD